MPERDLVYKKCLVDQLLPQLLYIRYKVCVGNVADMQVATASTVWVSFLENPTASSLGSSATQLANICILKRSTETSNQKMRTGTHDTEEDGFSACT